MRLSKLISRGVVAALLAMPLMAFADQPDIGDDKGSAFKGTQKVAIAEFGVEFYTQLSAEVHKNSGAAARVFTTLQGVGDEDFKAVTEKAYADTVAALKAAGFEVVDFATLAADSGYQALAKKYGAPSPYTFTDSSFVKSEPNISLIYAPVGMPAFFSSSLIRGDFGQRVDAQNQGRGAKEGDVAKSLGVTLLHIHYLVGFGQPSADKNNALFGSSWAHAKVEFGNTLFPQDSEWQFVTASGARTFTTSKRPRHSGALYLDAPLQSAAGNIFSQQDATTSADKKDDAAVGVANAMMQLGAVFG
ncbi:MAG: hypothetical protein E6Q40_00585, partial [Cupriavidus sp.]